MKITPILKPLKLSKSWLALSTVLITNIAHAHTDAQSHHSVNVFADLTTYSPAMPVHEFRKDWQGKVKTGDVAVLLADTGLRYQHHNSALAYYLGYRADYLLTFHPDTAFIYWHYKNKQQLPTNQAYQFHLDAEVIERYGMGMSYPFHYKNYISVTPQFNVWKGIDTVSGGLTGQATTLTTINDKETNELIKSLDKGMVAIDYHYHEAVLGEDKLDADIGKDTGLGYSVDVLLLGNYEKWHGKLHMRDMLGTMYWQDLSTSNYSIDYDASGRPLYNATGQLGQKNTTQPISMKTDGQVGYTLSHNYDIGSRFHINKLSQHIAGYVSITPQPWRDLAITAEYEFNTSAIGLGLKTNNLSAYLLTDAIELTKAYRLSASLAYQYQW